jgi:hypothetical protein
VPIQTGALAYSKSGPRVALPAHQLHYRSGYVTSVDHTGLLRRSARCSVITQRAHAVAVVLSQRPPPFLHVRPRALWLECGPVEKEKRPPPYRQRATWLSACRRLEKRSSSTYQHHAGKRSGGGYREGGPLADSRHALEHKISLHKAASEVCYIDSNNFQQRRHYWAWRRM